MYNKTVSWVDMCCSAGSWKIWQVLMVDFLHSKLHFIRMIMNVVKRELQNAQVYFAILTYIVGALASPRIFARSHA